MSLNDNKPPADLSKHLEEGPLDAGPLSAAMADNMAATRLRLLKYFPFFGSLVCRLNFRATKSTLAAVMNTGTVFINESFFNSLSHAEVAGVLCHEVLHPALLCFERRGDRDPHLWNAAHDYAINLIIKDASENGEGSRLQLPSVGLLDTKYTGMSAEAIYDDLLKNAPKQYVMCDMVGASTGDGEENNDPTQSAGGSTTSEQSDYWKRAVMSAAEAARQSGQGYIPAGIKIMLEKLSNPQVDWKTRLRQYIGDNYSGMDYTYRRRSRRQHAAGTSVVLAANDQTTAPEIIVLADTSGSMYDDLEMVLGEIDGIAKALRAPIRVVFCDAAVQGDVDNIRGAQDLLPHVKGGGGSDYMPAFKHIEKADPRSVIVCPTDGYIAVPKVPPKFQAVLWLVTPDGQDPTHGRYGKVIQLDKK